MRSFKLTLFSTAPVVSKCEENLSESIWNLFKINTIFCSHVQREACIAHTMPSEGFPEIYLKVSCCKFCTYRNFHRESFFFACLCLVLLHFNITINGEFCYYEEPAGKQYNLWGRKLIIFIAIILEFCCQFSVPDLSGAAVVYRSLEFPNAFSFISVFSLQKYRCSVSYSFIWFLFFICTDLYSPRIYLLSL